MQTTEGSIPKSYIKMISNIFLFVFLFIVQLDSVTKAVSYHVLNRNNI